MDNPDAFEGIQKGARNICLEGWTVGDATFQQRWTGYQKRRQGLERRSPR